MDSQRDPRSPLDARSLRAAVGSDWEVTLLPTAGSTNQVAAVDPRPGRVVVAEHQVAGRGRLDRTWTTPPGTALTLSAVVEPDLAPAQWPLLPLAAGMAVADGVRSLGAKPLLKWPNDVLIGEGKIAGILVERVERAGSAFAVIGIGINVEMRADELPVPTATSLALAGVQTSRTQVFAAVMASLRARLEMLESAPVDFVERYREACGTVGRQVEAHLPGGGRQRGRAVGVDENGRLEIDVEGRVIAVAAGDVTHLRPV